MRLIRPALALALASTALALAAPSAGSAATLPTPTRIVLFTGGGDATPVGPAVQPAGKWTVSTAPAKITTTNYGTLVEDTSLPGDIGSCVAQCGEWWYYPRPGTVHLLEFYWDETNGQQVLATNLVPPVGSGNWASLGGGTYTPLCLSWEVTSNNTATLHYIRLSLHTHDWSEISSAGQSIC